MAKLTRRSFLTTGLAATATGAIASEARAEAPAGEPAPSDPLSVQAEVDGESLTFLVGPDTTALHALRAAGRTGVKEGCGHGACGACTIVRDARTTCACLLPATALQGAKVTTVHGLGAKGLHPVQRAFMAEDALQCGFCTPGFVVEAADWVDRWRAEHGDVEPTRDRVAAALAGHLCRCGAYVAIYRAVQGAAAGRYDAGDDVGPRKDGHAKVTGEARYTVDVQLPGMLHGAILRAPFARGRLQRLDLAAARSVPGVHGVIRLLEDGASIRYFGQEIAAVAADDEASAQAGLKALAPELESERPILGFEDAMAEGAPTIFPKRAHKQAPSAAEGFLPPAPWDESNVRGPFRSDWFSGHRKASDILDEASLTVEERYETQIQAHCTLEPHATVAKVHESGQIEVWASTQAVVQLVHDIAERFDVHERDIVVHADYVGGGFGAKAGITIDAVVAIELAYETRRPVRVVLSREDEIAVGGVRPAQRFTIRLGATESGELAALHSEAYANGGVAVGTITGFLMRLIYPSSRKELRDYDVVTNSAPGKPLRAPGGPPAFFALEQTVDEIAVRRGESPLDLRRRWDENPGRLRIYDWLESLDAWKERATGEQTGRYRVGIGVASAAWFYFTQVNSQLEVTLDQGRLTARTSAQDMGNGTRSTIAYGLADALGLDPRAIEVDIGSSGSVVGPMSAGSRTTASLVPAAEHAAEQIRDALADHAREARGIRGKPQRHGLQHDAGGFTPWSDLLADAPPITVVGRRRGDDRAFFLPIAVGNLKIGRQSPGAVQMSRVEVDTWTGRVRVTGAWVGVSVGRIVAPPLARSQVEGGVVQGISYALYEDRRLDPSKGVLLTAGLEDYRLAGIGDVPPVVVHFDEQGFEDVRGGGVGLAEICTTPCAASIANAVANATGKRMRSLPLRPDVVKGVLA